MSEEDILIQQELVEEIMKASEQFPNVILYMETVMESYEELEKENQQSKEVIDELNEALNHIDDNIMKSCKNYDVNGIELKKILNKIKEN